MLSLTDVSKGDFLAGPEMTDVIFSRNVRNQSGQAMVNLARFPGTGGADGSGVLITLTFEAVAPGETTVSAIPTGARTAEQQSLQLGTAQAKVTVAQ